MPQNQLVAKLLPLPLHMPPARSSNSPPPLPEWFQSQECDLATTAALRASCLRHHPVASEFCVHFPSSCGSVLKWGLAFVVTSLITWAWAAKKREPSFVGYTFSSVQLSRSVVSNSCDPLNHSMPGLPVHHQLPEFTQTLVHWAGDTIQPSHPLSSPSPPAPNPSQQQSLFQWVNSSHEVAKVLP